MHFRKFNSDTRNRVAKSKAKAVLGAMSVVAGLAMPVYQAAALDLATAQLVESVGDLIIEDISPLYSVQNGLPLDDLYTVPKPLPYAAPGTLIKHDSTPFDGYVSNALYGAASVLPSGVSAYRFTYHPRSTAGKDVAASAVLLSPPGPTPPGGWPVIAWGHGTAGVAHNCAPSAMKDMYYGDTDLYGFLDSVNYPQTGAFLPGGAFYRTHDSYAVVAPDYTGLGTEFPHEYLSRIAQGQDLIWSIPAAHEVARRIGTTDVLSKKWVAVGHSQGGEAALGVAELEAVIRDPNYLGAVAVAPLTNLTETLKSMTNTTAGQGGYFPLVAYAVKSLFPWVQYSDLMTPNAINMLSVAPLYPPAATPETQLGCFYTASASDGFGSFTSYQQIFTANKPGKGINNPWLAAYSALNQPGTVQAFRPIMIAQSLQDEVIPVALTDKAVQKLCSVGDRVTYKKYDLTTIPPFYGAHTDSVYASFNDQMDWIEKRFAGQSVPNTCSN